MRGLTRLQTILAGLLSLAGLAGLIGAVAAGAPALAIIALGLAVVSLIRLRLPWPMVADGLLAGLGLVALLGALPFQTIAPAWFWLLLVVVWLVLWLLAERLSAAIAAGRLTGQGWRFLVPLLFGLAIIIAWEAGVRGGRVPGVILPPPSAVWARILTSGSTLWADFVQTFVKAVLTGYVLGCGAGLVVAILVDRSPFLKRGLLPIGNFVSALPIIGIAPILVLWFGYDWPSKAAVVVVVVFFPMLVNTVAGLNATGHIERDLMRTYAANYWQTLWRLRLPAAAPFIFNALKINSTLALIGAIVAEFFGTPIVGMGFRISTEVGRLNVDMVWAEIAMAALAGSLFYGLVALAERGVTFWHPSIRGG